MPVPWLQIVQLVPSILDLSRELLRKSKKLPAPQDSPIPEGDLTARIAALEANEQRQAELVERMARQIAQLTDAAMQLHRQMRVMAAGMAIALIVALIAIFMR